MYCFKSIAHEKRNPLNYWPEPYFTDWAKVSQKVDSSLLWCQRGF